MFQKRRQKYRMPYHIAIGRTPDEARYQLDLTEDQIRSLFIEPLQKGDHVFVCGVTFTAQDVGYMQVSFTTKNSGAVMKSLWERYKEYEERARLREETFDFPRPSPEEVFREGRDATLKFVG